MNIVIFFCILFVSTSVFSELLQENTNNIWGYDSDDGPNEWCLLLPNDECCGPHESPINIVAKTATPIPWNLRLINYERIPEEIIMTNNGHTVVLKQNKIKKVPKLSFGREKYFLESFHFHWGKNDDRGSEHSINGHNHPMEMHLVHVNIKYESSEEAGKHDDGLAVLSVLFEISYYDNINYKNLVNTLRRVKEENDTARVVKTFAMSSLLPHKLATAYHYKGSLTTPPCSQTVDWFILSNPVTLSNEQIRHYRQLRTEHYLQNSRNWTNEELADNYRDIHFPLNGRQVEICKARYEVDIELKMELESI